MGQPVLPRNRQASVGRNLVMTRSCRAEPMAGATTRSSRPSFLPTTDLGEPRAVHNEVGCAMNGQSRAFCIAALRRREHLLIGTSNDLIWIRRAAVIQGDGEAQ